LFENKPNGRREMEPEDVMRLSADLEELRFAIDRLTIATLQAAAAAGAANSDSLADAVNLVETARLRAAIR
jgi:aspartate-semialdehyde dehydrogenase